MITVSGITREYTHYCSTSHQIYKKKFRESVLFATSVIIHQVQVPFGKDGSWILNIYHFYDSVKYSLPKLPWCRLARIKIVCAEVRVHLRIK